MEPVELRVCSIKSPRHIALSLEGTILVCRTLKGRIEPEVHIPVELITIEESKRFDARRLITALLVFLAPVLMGVFVGMFLGPADAEQGGRTRLYEAFLVVWIVVLLVGFLAFCVLLVTFFFRAKTVCLIIAPHGGTIEFWRRRRCGKAIDVLLDGIRRRQKAVEDEAPTPAKMPAVYVDPPSLTRRFVAYLYLSVLPAVFAGQLRLLVLVALPILWYAVRQGQYLRQPAEYRRAVRCYRRKRWDETIELLTKLLSGYPDYFPAYILLVHVYTRSSRYDDALAAVAAYGERWPEISSEVYTAVWHCKRVGLRRVEQSLPADENEPPFPEGGTCE